MKKISIGLLFLSILFSSACSSAEEIISEDDQISKTGFAKSSLEREISPEIASNQIQTLSEDNLKFALSFYDQIRSEQENIIFSPLSISVALSMTMAGAEKTTEQTMIEALQLSLSSNDVHPAFNALLLAIENSQNKGVEDIEGSNFQLNIANSIWGHQEYEFKEAFLNTLARHYGAGIYTVDYVQNPEGARNAINEWVESETEEKIRDLIPQGAIDSLTRLVLANAIYFNGSWLHPFRESATAEANFNTLDNSDVVVDMMKLYDERLLYTQGESYQAVSLPYLSTDFVMTILIPDDGSFSTFEESLTVDELLEVINSMNSERIDLEMPKFDFETTINGNDPLIALGMSEAFDPGLSDFTGMADVEDLHITDVLHKATITVDEKGTEAAAATAVIVGITSAPPDEPISLVIDRPFLFLIRHQPTGSILFMGRVIQP